MARTPQAPAIHRITERAMRAHQLRTEGRTLEQIGDELGVHFSTISRDLAKAKAALVEDTQDLAAEIRVQEREELEAVRDAAWRIVHTAEDTGDPGLLLKAPAALQAALKASEQIRKLYGSDAPVRIESQARVELTAERAAEIVAEMEGGKG